MNAQYEPVIDQINVVDESDDQSVPEQQSNTVPQEQNPDESNLHPEPVADVPNQSSPNRRKRKRY